MRSRSTKVCWQRSTHKRAANSMKPSPGCVAISDTGLWPKVLRRGANLNSPKPAASPKYRDGISPVRCHWAKHWPLPAPLPHHPHLRKRRSWFNPARTRALPCLHQDGPYIRQALQVLALIEYLFCFHISTLSHRPVEVRHDLQCRLSAAS